MKPKKALKFDGIDVMSNAVVVGQGEDLFDVEGFLAAVIQLNRAPRLINN